MGSKTAPVRLAYLVLIGVAAFTVWYRFAPVPGKVTASALPAQSDSFPTFTHVTVDPDGSAPSNCHCKAIGDLNGDGYPDLLVASSTCGDRMVWYQSPSWTKHVISTLGGWSTYMQVADLNGDGWMDVIIPAWYRSGDMGDENGLEWWENTGGGVSWVRHYIGLPMGHDVEVADLDADGLPDLVTRLQGGEGVAVEIWRQSRVGGALQWTHRTLTGLPQGEGLAVADISGDGYPDIVLGAIWLENPHDLMQGPWTPHTCTTSWSAEAAKTKAADLNGDGRLDIVLAPAESAGDPPYKVCWYEAPADPRSGGWTEHVIDPDTERVLHSLQVGDIDGDGDPDVVAAEMHQGDDPDEVRVYANGGQGLSWTKHVIATNGSHNLQLGDVDGDGDIDLFGTNWDGDASTGNQVDLWRNDLSQNNHVAYDINADGRVDVSDLLLLAQDFGSRGGDLRYAATRDLNKDVQIDVSDLLILAGNWLRLIGDINADGRVDVSDLLMLAQHFGLRASALWSASKGDLNGDDQVDVSDVLILARNWLRLFCDINADGRIDVSDLLMLAQDFGSRAGDVRYVAACDLNGDGRIDVSELLILAGSWGA
jgi:Ca2+-binding EF-hand superfamily protein